MHAHLALLAAASVLSFVFIIVVSVPYVSNDLFAITFIGILK